LLVFAWRLTTIRVAMGEQFRRQFHQKFRRHFHSLEAAEQLFVTVKPPIELGMITKLHKSDRPLSKQR
jgi:hypothetical protein